MAFLLMLLPLICSICKKRANLSMSLLLICLICKKWGKWGTKKRPRRSGVWFSCVHIIKRAVCSWIGKRGSYSGVSLG